MKTYKNTTYDQERALYSVEDANIIDCKFEGPADGESPLKECKNINVENSYFGLRYPFWHISDSKLKDCSLAETCRAALWYDKNVLIENCIMNGIKAVRECSNISINNCIINSSEFGWYSKDIKIKDSELTSEYQFMQSKNIEIDNFKMKGKYSFQYAENIVIKNSFLDTKDAFWHSKNIVVENSIVKGEYLGWYSEGLKLINCKIIGTQPLCYCDKLIIENCEMIDTDLSFEYSDVNAVIKGNIESIKNPKSGFIKADSIGKIILDEYKVKDMDCEIKCGKRCA